MGVLTWKERRLGYPIGEITSVLMKWRQDKCQWNERLYIWEKHNPCDSKALTVAIQGGRHVITDWRMNHHERQSCEKQMWLQDMSAATGCSKEPCLLGWSRVGRACCSGRRGRGRGSHSCERRLVTLNLVILIIAESRRCTHLLLSIIVQWRWSRNTLGKRDSQYKPTFAC